jgi:hypothetical protein
MAHNLVSRFPLKGGFQEILSREQSITHLGRQTNRLISVLSTLTLMVKSSWLDSVPAFLVTSLQADEDGTVLKKK